MVFGSDVKDAARFLLLVLSDSLSLIRLVFSSLVCSFTPFAVFSLFDALAFLLLLLFVRLLFVFEVSFLISPSVPFSVDDSTCVAPMFHQEMYSLAEA